MHYPGRPIRLVLTLARRALLTAALLAASAASLQAAPCDVAGSDAAAVAAARAAVQAACDCEAAVSSGAWRRCVRDTVRTLGEDALSASCARHVSRIEGRSTCGRTDRVVCCRTSLSGRTTATRRFVLACTAPSGGAACVSPLPYLDDGCTEDGCADPGEQQVFCGDGPVTPSCSPAIASQAVCAAQGGCWVRTPFHPDGYCNCPTLDAGRTCTSDADCAGLCTTPDTGQCESLSAGTCSSVETPFGCWCLAPFPGEFYWRCID